MSEQDEQLRAAYSSGEEREEDAGSTHNSDEFCESVSDSSESSVSSVSSTRAKLIKTMGCKRFFLHLRLLLKKNVLLLSRHKRTTFA